MPPFLSTPFILHSVTTSRASNTHQLVALQLVVGMTVYTCGSTCTYICLDHVLHDYCTLETLQSTSHCMYIFHDTHTYTCIHQVYSTCSLMFIGTLLFITGPEDCSPLCQ